MSILSSVIHSNIIPNLYASLSTAEHKRRHFEECFNCSFLYNESQWGPKQHWTPVCTDYFSSKYQFLHSAEEM